MNENAPTSSSQVRATREGVWLALALAWVAGFVDVTGYLAIVQVFTSHMSGNSVAMMAFLTQHKWSEAFRRAFPIPLFVLGIIGGTALEISMSRRHLRRQLSICLLLEAGLLIAFLICGIKGLRAEASHAIPIRMSYTLTAILALAMGVQTSAMRRVWGRPVHTTFVTGMLTLFAEAATVLLFYGYDGLRKRASTRTNPDRSKQLRRLFFYGGIWVAFVFGAVSGGYGAERWGLFAIFAPLCALVAIILYDLKWPVTGGVGIKRRDVENRGEFEQFG